MTSLWRLMHGKVGLFALAGLVASSVVVTLAWVPGSGQSVLTQVLGLSASRPAPAVPAILSGPAAPTTSTVATFTYSDSTTGATFMCSLDSGPFGPCSSTGVTYSGLSEGSHTFGVEAVASGATSTPATRTWSVDRTPPVIAVSFPANNGVYSASGWATGCSPRGLCGTATDATGVASVRVAIFQQATSLYWNGSAFASVAMTYQTATGGATWRYSLPVTSLSDGGYTLSLQATDALGNATPAGSPLITTFKIDTVAPPAPAITQHPDDPTSETSAQFGFTDAEAGVVFRCSLDSAAATVCTSTVQYTGLASANHCFQVIAVDAAGNLSPVSSFCWTIVINKSFPISGSTTQTFAPGVTQSLDLTFTNPYNFDIQVTSVSITVKDVTTKNGVTNPDCIGPTNLVVSRQFSGPVTVLSNSTRSLSSSPAVSPSQWPQLTMPNLSTNQDECKSTTFALTYQGTAVKP